MEVEGNYAKSNINDIFPLTFKYSGRIIAVEHNSKRKNNLKPIKNKQNQNTTPQSTKQYHKNKNNGVKRINLDLPELLWLDVAELTELKGINKREIVIDALENYLYGSE